jgi:hypothetical protein
MTNIHQGTRWESFRATVPLPDPFAAPKIRVSSSALSSFLSKIGRRSAGVKDDRKKAYHRTLMATTVISSPGPPGNMAASRTA